MLQNVIPFLSYSPEYIIQFPEVSYKKYIYSVLGYQPCHSGVVVKRLFIKSSPLVPNREQKNLQLSHTLKSQLNSQTHRTHPCGVIAKSLLSEIVCQASLRRTSLLKQCTVLPLLWRTMLSVYQSLKWQGDSSGDMTSRQFISFSNTCELLAFEGSLTINFSQTINCSFVYKQHFNSLSRI